MNNNNNNIEIHKESDFILFLKHSEIQLTPEIRLLYHMADYNVCFVCLHIDTYYKENNHYESYYELKDHFIKEHTKDHEGNRRDKGSAFGSSLASMHDYYSKTKLLVWNNNKILGLIDQMIVLENYLDRRISMRGKKKKKKSKDPDDKRLIFYRDLGRCIIKIMKEYQIPQLMFIKYFGLTPIALEQYTTAYYMSLDDKDKPGWMRRALYY